MSELDDNLAMKLKALVGDEWDYDDFVKEGLKSYITAIKKAFADAGYVQIPQVELKQVNHNGYVPKAEIFTVNGKEVMTGQEWYDRFKRELKYDTRTILNQCSDCGAPYNYEEAAKRAAGIE